MRLVIPPLLSTRCARKTTAHALWYQDPSMLSFVVPCVDVSSDVRYQDREEMLQVMKLLQQVEHCIRQCGHTYGTHTMHNEMHMVR